MRFREVERNIEREIIKKKEEEIIKKKEEENFKKIKPEGNISVEEAKRFWTMILTSERES